jgi:sec-independent protein translocase protein TatC
MAIARREMPFLEHLEELRWRIIWSFLALAVGSAIGIIAVLRFEVINILTAPLYAAFSSLAEADPELAAVLGSGRLVFLDLGGPLFFAIKLGLIVGLVLSSPVVIYQLWTFLAPALEDRERRVIVPCLTLGLLLFAAGVALGYFAALPLTIRFLLAFGAEWFTPSLTTEFYFPLVFRILLTFGLVFELPVVILILSGLGVVTPAMLRAKRKHAIVVMLVGASLLTPGDVLSLTVLLMVPMIVLYEGSIVLSALVRRERPEVVGIIAPLLFLYETRQHLRDAARRWRDVEVQPTDAARTRW